ncbi:MAG TPA: sigma-70 family RNA polymerase sigma factor [Candidatus Acidoferrales bacterium]|jgi:RNA polymerase sigma-70 factor (ECF subfamily)|nr:sigma-70 family RNA polymerase sigma factor [Candidatus Acidoferrales bacterium]
MSELTAVAKLGMFGALPAGACARDLDAASRTLPAADDEAALVAAAKAGDLGAFEKLVDRYSGRIFRLARNLTKTGGDAEDVVQDAFLKAFQHLSSFRGDSRFYTWLVRIAMNEFYMKLRKRRPGVVSLDEPADADGNLLPRELEDWGPTPEERYGQTELREILEEAIAGLGEANRVVFHLRDVEGFSTEETASILSVSIPTVKSRLLRARLHLREKLSKHFRFNSRRRAETSIAQPGGASASVRPEPRREIL